MQKQRLTPLPRRHHGAVKRIRQNPKHLCGTCGAEAGLLLITLPTHTFQRARTPLEAMALNALAETKSLTFEHMLADRRRRKLRVCPKCIKPLQETNGELYVNHWKVGS